jgi:hypothetical protein
VEGESSSCLVFNVKNDKVLGRKNECDFSCCCLFGFSTGMPGVRIYQLQQVELKEHQCAILRWLICSRNVFGLCDGSRVLLRHTGSNLKGKEKLLAKAEFKLFLVRNPKKEPISSEKGSFLIYLLGKSYLHFDLLILNH